MQSPLRLAADGLLAFAAGLLAVTGSTAHAQSDPFALPPSMTSAVVKTASGPGPSEIEIDGSVKARLVDLQGHGDAMTIDADNARVAGLPVPDGATGPIRIAALGLYQWSFDSLRQRLVVRLFQRAEGRNMHDFAMRDTTPTARRMAPAFRLDYDVTASARPGSVSAGGLFGAAFIKGEFTAASAVQVVSGTRDSPARATRLDSFARALIPGTTTVATAGDFITKGSTSQRALRVGGLQIASDFSQQPNLVTQPLPSFRGSVAVPTSVDVLVADNTFKVGELEPGDFAIRNVPAVDGRGSMTVLLKDSLGRQVAQTVQFYNSATLLRPGLSAYAVNAGFVRRRYGEASADYGPFMASAFFRRGLSPFLTVEASGESTAGLVNFGIRADFTLGNVALAGAEVRGSDDSRVGRGGMFNFSLESLGNRFNARLGASLPTPEYRDVASRLGDRPPAEQLFANISYRLAPRLPIQISYVRQSYRQRDSGDFRLPSRNETLSLGINYAPNSRTSINLNAGLQDHGQRSFFVVAGLNLRLGNHHSVGAGLRTGADQSLAAVNYRYEDTQNIGFQNTGLRALAALESLNGHMRLAGEASYLSRWAEVQAGVVMTGDAVGGQLSAHGSLVAVEGGVHAMSDENSSFLLVRSDGVEGIPVLLDNHFVGKTDAAGKLFVRNLIPRAHQRVDVDGSKLPNDAIVTASRHIVSIPAQAVGVVDIAATYYRPVIIQVVDDRGQQLAPGLRAIARPSNHETQVGYDGLLEFNAAGTDSSLLIEKADGNCVVDVVGVSPEDGVGKPLVCRATEQFVESEAAGEEAPKRRLADRKVARRN